MKIHEYQAKEILEQYDIPIQGGIVLDDTEKSNSVIDQVSEKFNVEGSEIENLINEGKETQKESTSLYDFTRVINDDFSFEEKFKLIKSMWEIAFADGNIDKYEEYVIRKVSDLIYISNDDFIKAKLEVKNENK